MDVSIIIPAYQSGKYLSRAIRSAIDQNYPKNKYEIIVIDDGSTDNTSDIAKTYIEDIRYFRHDHNKGLPSARNTGLKLAKGRYVVNLDSDDYMHKDLLKVGSLFLSLNISLDAVSFDYYIVDDNENHLEYLSAEEFPIACGIMFRKEQLIDIGLYDETFLIHEDQDLRKRFLTKYKIYNIPVPLYRYRRHENNMTNNKENVEKYLKKLNNKYGNK